MFGSQSFNQHDLIIYNAPHSLSIIPFVWFVYACVCVCEYER